MGTVSRRERSPGSGARASPQFAPSPAEGTSPSVDSERALLCDLALGARQRDQPGLITSGTGCAVGLCRVRCPRTPLVPGLCRCADRSGRCAPPAPLADRSPAGIHLRAVRRTGTPRNHRLEGPWPSRYGRAAVSRAGSSARGGCSAPARGHRRADSVESCGDPPARRGRVAACDAKCRAAGGRARGRAPSPHPSACPAGSIGALRRRTTHQPGPRPAMYGDGIHRTGDRG